MGAIRAGHLRLARSWAENGSVYAAISAYMDIVHRYPGSGAARAATEGLLELAESLEGNGMYYTAQNIFRQLEQVVWE
jgi:TolA-binding protein